MRFKGKISEWNDDRGFGFISPAEGGPAVFCHIKAFTERTIRPEPGKIVTYELSKDERGRPRATLIRYSGAPKPAPAAPPPRQSSVASAVVGATASLAGVAALAFIDRISWWVLAWYLGLSVVTFFAYGWDKVSARGGHWRTQESTLNGLALFGGWPGGWVAQHAWRHKNRKASFQAAFWGAVAVNVGVLLVIAVFGIEPLLQR